MNTNSDTKSTIKTMSINTIANVLALCVGVIAMPIIARLMSQEDLGLAATFLANRNIFVIIIMLGIYYFTNRAMLEFAEEKIDYIYTVTLFCCFMTLFTFVVCMPFKSYIQEWLSLDDFLYYWFYLSIFAYSLYSLAYYYCYFNNYTKLVTTMTLTIGPASQIVSIIVIFVMTTNQYIGRVISLDFAYIVISIIFIIWLMTKIRNLHPKIKYITTSLKVTIPLIPHAASQMALSQMDLIMISSLIGAAESGIYTMGHTIGFLAYSILAQVMASWSPWAYRRMNEENFQAIQDKSVYIMLLGIALSIGLMTVSPELVVIFLPESYLPTIYVIPPLVASMFMQFFYLFAYDIEYFYKKTIRIAVSSIIVVALNFVLNLVLIPIFGFITACYTTLACYFLSFVLNFIFAYPLGIKKIYNIKFMLLSMIVITIFLILDLFFINQIIIRYTCFALAIIVFAFLYGKRIGMFLYQLKK